MTLCCFLQINIELFFEGNNIDYTNRVLMEKFTTKLNDLKRIG
jgi:hypothetical protein